MGSVTNSPLIQLTMSDIKLTYFYGKGRAEISRLILAFAGVNYQDNRITGEEFKAIKPFLDYGQVPKLEYKGNVIYQSRSIARFLAKEFGLAGKTNVEVAKADEVVDAITDLQNSAYTVMFEKDEKVKQEKMKKVYGEVLPSGLANLEKILIKNGGKHFAGNSFTWADLDLLMLVDFLSNQKDDILESLPRLSDLVKRTREVPNIKRWLKERPADGVFIKLTYFNIRGRAETARLILAYAGAKYDDERVTGEEFALMKPSLSYGQLPRLRYKGKEFFQSMAVARFLAAEFGLEGRDNVEKAEVNEVVDAINDMQTAVFIAMREKNEAEKALKMKKALEETVPAGLRNLEKVLSNRGGQFFAGNALTWAELHFLQFVDFMLRLSPQVLENSPLLKDNLTRTKDLPNIKKWIGERPKSDL